MVVSDDAHLPPKRPGCTFGARTGGPDDSRYGFRAPEASTGPLALLGEPPNAHIPKGHPHFKPRSRGTRCGCLSGEDVPGSSY